MLQRFLASVFLQPDSRTQLCLPVAEIPQGRLFALVRATGAEEMRLRTDVFLLGLCTAASATTVKLMANTSTTLLPNLRSSLGMPTLGGGELSGFLVRSCDPRHAEPSDARSIVRDFGIAAVLDLRARREVADLGPSLPHLPHVFADLTLPDQDCGLVAHLAPERLSRWLPDAMKLMAQSEGSVLVHCQAGWDRTGLVCCFLQMMAGATKEAVVNDWAQTVSNVPQLASVLGNDPYVREHLPQGLRRLEKASSDPDSYVQSLRETAREVVDFVGGHDGALRVVRESGVAEADLLAVASRMNPFHLP